MRSESLYIPPKISESLIEKTVKKIKRTGVYDHSVNLKERGMARSLISAGLIEKAKELIEREIPEAYKSSVKIRGLFDALQFLNHIEN